MVEFLRKFENRGIKIAQVNSIIITKSRNLQVFTIFCAVLGSVGIVGDFPDKSMYFPKKCMKYVNFTLSVSRIRYYQY